MQTKKFLVQYSAFRTHFKKVKNNNLENHITNLISKSRRIDWLH